MPQIDIYNFFIFAIPGFIMVRSFYYFTESKNDNQFEYFVLSIFWGLILFVLCDIFQNDQIFARLIKNPYATAITLSFFGTILGWIGSIVFKTSFFVRADRWLKNIHF